MSSLKIKDKPASIPAAVFGWRFLPMLTIAPLPSHTLGGVVLHTLLQRLQKCSFFKGGGKEGRREDPTYKSSALLVTYILLQKCFSGVILVNLVEIYLSYIEMLKIYLKCRQVLKTSMQFESCLIDLT